MRILPSRVLKKQMQSLTNDNEYVNDLTKRSDYLKSITGAIESPFGVSLFNALDNIEGAAIEALYNAGTKAVESQARAEIKVARYLKGTFMGYVHEQQALDNAIAQWVQMEQGEQYEPQQD